MDEARRVLGAVPDPPPRGPLVLFLRRLTREALLIPILVLDLGRRAGAYLLRSEYRLGGACHRRGACCHHILLEWTPLFDRFPVLARVVLWKYTRLHHFYDKGYTWEVEDGLMARVLGCHALRPDGQCGDYRLRPLVCRTYPEVPLIGKPMLLKGCGFKFERRDGRGEPDPDGLVRIGRPKRVE